VNGGVDSYSCLSNLEFSDALSFRGLGFSKKIFIHGTRIIDTLLRNGKTASPIYFSIAFFF